MTFKKKGLTPKTIKRLFETFEAHDPDPKTELNYQTPFQLLVAVILSAQATDKSVNRVTEALFKSVDTPIAMLAFGEQALIDTIHHLNYYKTKAKHILKTAQLLCSQHQGQIPAEREALEALPGVGRKTANVILNTLFNQPTIAVDTHIFRVANRAGLAAGTTPISVEMQLKKNIPKRYHQKAHHWLVLHGRYVCLARKPRCAQCIIQTFCYQYHLDKSNKTQAL